MLIKHLDNKILTRTLGFALLIGLLLSEYAEILLGSHSFFFRDFAIFSYPNAFYVRKCFLNCELPLLNPLNEFGIPFLAQWNTMVLYPFNFLFFIFPPEFGISLFPLIHLVFGGCGMFLLIKTLSKNEIAGFIAAIGYEFNGITVNSLMWTNNSAAFGWMPWVILSVVHAVESGKTKHVINSIMISSIQILTGAPEIIVFTWITCLIIGIHEIIKSKRKNSSAKALILIIISAAGLTSVQTLPFLELLSHSHRTLSGGDSSWSLSSLFNLIAPLYNSFQWEHGVIFQKGQYWTSSIYIPIGIVWLAIIGAILSKNQIKWLFVALLILGILLSYGENFALWNSLKKIIPLIEMFRFPIKFFVLSTFSILFLATFGLTAFMEKEKGQPDFLKKFIPLLTYLFIILILIIALSTNCSINIEQSKFLENILLRFLFLTLYVITLYIWRASPSINYICLPLSLCIVFFDFKTHAPRQNPTVQSWVFKSDLLETERPEGFKRGRIQTRHDKDFFKFNKIRNDAEREVVSKRLGLYSNLNLLEGIGKLSGMFSLHLATSKILLDKIYEHEESLPPSILNFLNINWVLLTGKQFTWTNNQSALPLLFSPETIEFVADNDAVGLLFSEKFNPEKNVLLPLNLKNTLVRLDIGKGKIQNLKIQNHFIKASIKTEKNCVVLLSMAIYPCWKATVDNHKFPVYRSNFGFQAVIVPPGDHIVIFFYRDTLFLLGLFISAIFILSLAILRYKTMSRFEKPS